jgi:predicted alpha/beta superfamily hydrolase
MKNALLFIIILFGKTVFSQTSVNITITNLPNNHPYDEDVYIAGTFNGWDPGAPAYILTLNADNTYSITLTGTGTINFKFTRGDWTKVEKGASCEEISNRSYTFGQGDYNAQVLNWADLCGGGGTHTAADNVAILDEAFYMPQLNRDRRIWLYLPPDYDTSSKDYPVLYMHDGQNLFDDYYSFAGEWGVDESLNDLSGAGDYGCMVVCIDNGGILRIDEYSPWNNPDYGGGEGELYMQFIVETLKPYIDSQYRTLPEREHTGIMGSSMGALISHYGGIEYQETFSKLGLFSPSFWFTDSCYTFAAETPKEFDMKLYFLGGGQEPGVIEDCMRMIDTLTQAGYGVNEMFMKAVEAGQHSEWFWKQEFPAAYQWLFPEFNTVESVENDNITVYPNPSNGIFKVKLNTVFPFDQTDKQITIADISGRIIDNASISGIGDHITIDLSNAVGGIYFITCVNNDKVLKFKVLKKL